MNYVLPAWAARDAELLRAMNAYMTADPVCLGTVELAQACLSATALVDGKPGTFNPTCRNLMEGLHVFLGSENALRLYRLLWESGASAEAFALLWEGGIDCDYMTLVKVALIDGGLQAVFSAFPNKPEQINTGTLQRLVDMNIQEVNRG